MYGKTVCNFHPIEHPAFSTEFDRQRHPFPCETPLKHGNEFFPLISCINIARCCIVYPTAQDYFAQFWPQDVQNWHILQSYFLWSNSFMPPLHQFLMALLWPYTRNCTVKSMPRLTPFAIISQPFRLVETVLHQQGNLY